MKSGVEVGPTVVRPPDARKRLQARTCRSGGSRAAGRSRAVGHLSRRLSRPLAEPHRGRAALARALAARGAAEVEAGADREDANNQLGQGNWFEYGTALRQIPHLNRDF